MKLVKRLYQFIPTFIAIVLLVTNTGFTVYAAEPDREAQREEHKALPIQTYTI